MHVLMLESAPGVSTAAEHHLLEAGHQVSRCHAPGDDGFPCKGITGRCPLDDGDVDLVVTVREPNRSRPTPLEDGASCGLRQRIPLVVAGRIGHPFRPFAARTVDPDADLARACEAVVENPMEPHSAIATSAARDVLARHDIDAEALARVRRRGGRLHAEIVVGAVDVPVGMVTTRVLAALRRLDPHAAGVDVTLRRG